jgi:hypothetical protein
MKRPTSLLLAVLVLPACATPTSTTTGSGSGGGAAAVQASPECQAARLKDPDPLPVSALPEDVLRKVQSGYVVVRYDVVGGRTRNATVVASEPARLCA